MLLSAKDYQCVLDFIYDFDSSLDFSPSTLLNLLVKHFSFKNVGFVSYTNQLSSNNPSLNFNVFNNQPFSKNISELAIIYNEVPAELEYLRYYNRKYYREDFMDPFHLPPEFRGRAALRAKDLPKEFYEGTDYYKYLVSLDLCYFMSVYLYKGTKCIGRIGLLRSRSENDFSDTIVHMMEIISRHISQKLILANEYDEVARSLSLFNIANEKLPVGVVILDSHFSIIYCNSTANKIADEVVESQNYNICGNNHIRGDSSISIIVKHMLDQYLSNDRSTYMELNLGFTEYTCNLYSFIKADKKNDPTTYYLIYINKSSNVKDNSLLRFVNKYKITNREIDVLQLLCKGYNNSKISSSLVLSNYTVKTHVSNIFKKTGCSDRLSLVYKFKEETEL